MENKFIITVPELVSGGTDIESYFSERISREFGVALDAVNIRELDFAWEIELKEYEDGRNI